MNDKTRRDVILEAFDKAEASEETTEEVVEQEASEEVSEEVSEESVEQKEVKASEADGDKEESTEEKVDGSPDDPKKKAEVSDEEAAKRAGTAPLGWKDDAKAEWSKIPEAARREIAKRETEVQRALTYSAQARGFINEFHKVVQPYQRLIEAQGSTPLRAVGNLMQTAAVLNTGTAQQKAKIVTDICMGYGIDLKMLDDMLDYANKNPHRVVQESGQGFSPQQLNVLKPLFDLADQNRAQSEERQREHSNRAATKIEEMRQNTEKFPYLDRVRESMADVMEVSAKRGKFMTLEDAYSMAVSIDPTLAKATAQNKSIKDASEAGKALAKARIRRSSTIKAPKSTVKLSGPPKSRREAIERAFEEAGRA